MNKDQIMIFISVIVLMMGLNVGSIYYALGEIEPDRNITIINDSEDDSVDNVIGEVENEFQTSSQKDLSVDESDGVQTNEYANDPSYDNNPYAQHPDFGKVGEQYPISQNNPQGWVPSEQ
ncbi:hypothetical protein [Methanobrevibacter sp. DSM 116169]|uniref:hypothetical protein n=1 Tax=Methanobrevibacter sp. DSM 116169 TaxID=3242727 RepID=UPI0038FC7793